MNDVDKLDATLVVPRDPAGSAPGAAQAALELEERFRSFIPRSLDGIVIINGEGQIVEWNSGEEQITGIPRSEALGQPLWEVQYRLVPQEKRTPAFLEIAREEISNGLKEGAGLRRVVEDEIQSLDGARRTIQSVIFSIQTGEELLACGISRDITERKRVEETLRQSEARLRLALEGGQIGYWEWDLQADSIYRCDRVCELFGLDTVSENHLETFLEIVHPEDQGSLRKLIAQGIENQTDLKVEFRVLRQGREPGDELRWLAAQCRVVRDDRNRAVRMIGVVYDITGRKQIETELRRLNEHLEQQVQARVDELDEQACQLQRLTLEITRAEDQERRRLSEILHDDVQQLLAAAKFRLSMLGARLEDATLRQMAEQIREILADAIDKSRSLSHELRPPVLSHVDICETFEWLAEQMKAKHGLTVHLQHGERIELQSDLLRTFLYKAAQELLFNVIKHARTQEARVGLRRRHGRLHLLVSDDGPGFDARKLDQGTGYGLSSIRERVKAFSGRLSIRSVKGKGSLFVIALPDPMPAERPDTADEPVT